MNNRLMFPQAALAGFCRRWRITDLALFGSALRDDFGPDSDIDLLVTFAPDAHWTLFNLVEMQDELKAMLGRDVDLVTRSGVEHGRNRTRREAILASAESIYAER